MDILHCRRRRSWMCVKPCQHGTSAWLPSGSSPFPRLQVGAFELRSAPSSGRPVRCSSQEARARWRTVEERPMSGCRSEGPACPCRQRKSGRAADSVWSRKPTGSHYGTRTRGSNLERSAGRCSTGTALLSPTGRQWQPRTSGCSVRRDLHRL